jgi:hypothetical protein
MLAFFWLLFHSPANAHIMGTATWCLANSPVHYECQFEDRDICDKTAQKRTTIFERWDCVPYPMDFRNIPKEGETPVKVSPEKK